MCLCNYIFLPSDQCASVQLVGAAVMVLAVAAAVEAIYSHLS